MSSLRGITPLICNEKVTVLKEYNLTLQCSTKHAEQYAKNQRDEHTTSCKAKERAVNARKVVSVSKTGGKSKNRSRLGAILRVSSLPPSEQIWPSCLSRKPQQREFYLHTFKRVELLLK